jgi:hypothetical protein
MEGVVIRKKIIRITNRIHGDFVHVFPGFRNLLYVDYSTGIAILEEYSTPDVVAKTDPDKILKIMHRVGMKPLKSGRCFNDH